MDGNRDNKYIYTQKDKCNYPKTHKLFVYEGIYQKQIVNQFYFNYLQINNYYKNTL